jgi:predicted dehydrogenase
VRTSIIVDYGDMIRCSLTLNHTHQFGPRYAMSQLKVEGTRGAAIAKMGVNINYPHGEPDALELVAGDSVWASLPLPGEDPALVSGVEDAFHTMAVVEACYESSAHGVTPIPAGD